MFYRARSQPNNNSAHKRITSSEFHDLVMNTPKNPMSPEPIRLGKEDFQKNNDANAHAKRPLESRQVGPGRRNVFSPGAEQKNELTSKLDKQRSPNQNNNINNRPQ